MANSRAFDLRDPHKFIPHIVDHEVDGHQKSDRQGDYGSNHTVVDQPKDNQHQLDDNFNLDGCRNIFLDIGSNVGVQVRKLFEGHLYPGSKFLDVFNKYFGPPALRSRPSSETGLCAVGFEANPHRERRLREIQNAYLKNGWRVHFFVPIAVDKVGGKKVMLHLPGAHLLDPTEVGSSIVFAVQSQAFTSKSKAPRTAFQEDVVVKTFDIAAWINGVVAARSRGNSLRLRSYVIAKMDIEGSEYFVLPRMMRLGLLCKGIIDEVLIEWHEKFAWISGNAYRHFSVLEQLNKFSSNSGQRCGYGIKASKVTEFDDEKYALDTKPLQEVFDRTRLSP